MAAVTLIRYVLLHDDVGSPFAIISFFCPNDMNSPTPAHPPPPPARTPNVMRMALIIFRTPIVVVSSIFATFRRKSEGGRGRTRHGAARGGHAVGLECHRG